MCEHTSEANARLPVGGTGLEEEPVSVDTNRPFSVWKQRKSEPSKYSAADNTLRSLACKAYTECICNIPRRFRIGGHKNASLPKEAAQQNERRTGQSTFGHSNGNVVKESVFGWPENTLQNDVE
jgi:hypothetical protein